MNYLDSATWSVTHGANHCSRGNPAPTQLVWVEHMIMHYSSAQKKTLLPARRFAAGGEKSGSAKGGLV